MIDGEKDRMLADAMDRMLRGIARHLEKLEIDGWRTRKVAVRVDGNPTSLMFDRVVAYVMCFIHPSCPPDLLPERERLAFEDETDGLAADEAARRILGEMEAWRRKVDEAKSVLRRDAEMREKR